MHLNRSGRARLFALSATASAVAALTTAVAQAAATSHTHKNRIHVSGAKVNTYGTSFYETVSGHAAGAANYVISGEQIHKGTGCAATYNAEKNRPDFYAWPTGTGQVHGKFSMVASFFASHLGRTGSAHT